MNRKAFSFVEIVVVIAIFGLFLAMMLSFFSAARRQAQSNAEASYGEVLLESNEDNAYHFLPLTATNIIKHGNDWYEFTLNENRWLYHTDGYDQESLVLIPKG